MKWRLEEEEEEEQQQQPERSPPPQEQSEDEAQESDSEGIKKVNRAENVDQDDTSDDSE